MGVVIYFFCTFIPTNLHTPLPSSVLSVLSLLSPHQPVSYIQYAQKSQLSHLKKIDWPRDAVLLKFFSVCLVKKWGLVNDERGISRIIQKLIDSIHPWTHEPMNPNERLYSPLQYLLNAGTEHINGTPIQSQSIDLVQVVQTPLSQNASLTG